MRLTGSASSPAAPVPAAFQGAGLGCAVLAVPPVRGEPHWQRKSVTVEKASLYLLWFARGVTQCIAQDVRRLIITLPANRAGKGRWPAAACTRPPRPAGWQLPLRGAGAAGRIPSVRGATRGLWARPHAWGPRAPVMPIWPQIVLRLARSLALLWHGMLCRGPAVSHGRRRR